jgi:hypothetical protein
VNAAREVPVTEAVPEPLTAKDRSIQIGVPGDRPLITPLTENGVDILAPHTPILNCPPEIGVPVFAAPLMGGVPEP